MPWKKQPYRVVLRKNCSKNPPNIPGAHPQRRPTFIVTSYSLSRKFPVIVQKFSDQLYGSFMSGCSCHDGDKFESNCLM